MSILTHCFALSTGRILPTTVAPRAAIDHAHTGTRSNHDRIVVAKTYSRIGLPRGSQIHTLTVDDVITAEANRSYVVVTIGYSGIFRCREKPGVFQVGGRSV